MYTMLKGGTIVDDGRRFRSDILIEDGRIAEMGPDLTAPRGAGIIDVSGCIITSGFVDVHVHLREPGFPDKETIRTGSLAAARGGYTTVCAMPNLNPVPDSEESLGVEQAIIDRDAVIDVLPYCSITKGRKGLELVDFHTLKHLCVAFSDDGSGVQSGKMMSAAMAEAAREGCIIAAHCEDNSLLPSPESEWGQIRRDVGLCERSGCRYHVCHISTERSVEIIREAKSRGVRITCETAPHYLCLCEDDIREDDGRFRMNPPLRTATDRDALVDGLRDGTIDVIATDHAPHTAAQKSARANGIVGLETAFPVLYTKLVKTGKISLERLVETLTSAPRRSFSLTGGLTKGMPADITVIDLSDIFKIETDDFLSKGHSSPFGGWEVFGRIVYTFKSGKAVFHI